VYRVNGMSEEGFKDTTVQYDVGSFVGVITENIQRILNGSLQSRKSLDVEGSVGIERYLAIQGRSAFSTILELCRRARSAANPSSAYIFHDTLRKGFQCRTIEGITKDTPELHYFLRHSILDILPPETTIMEYTAEKKFNIIENAVGGGYASLPLSWDLYGKELHGTRNTTDSTFSSNRQFLYPHDSTVQNSEELAPWIAKKAGYLSGFYNAGIVKIKVPGNTQLGAGMMIDIQIGHDSQNSKPVNHFVVSVTHVILTGSKFISQAILVPVH
jgi:hypothetical protein